MNKLNRNSILHANKKKLSLKKKNLFFFGEKIFKTIRTYEFQLSLLQHYLRKILSQVFSFDSFQVLDFSFISMARVFKLGGMNELKGTP